MRKIFLVTVAFIFFASNFFGQVAFAQLREPLTEGVTYAIVTGGDGRKIAKVSASNVDSPSEMCDRLANLPHEILLKMQGCKISHSDASRLLENRNLVSILVKDCVLPISFLRAATKKKELKTVGMDSCVTFSGEPFVALSDSVSTTSLSIRDCTLEVGFFAEANFKDIEFLQIRNGDVSGLLSVLQTATGVTDLIVDTELLAADQLAVFANLKALEFISLPRQPKSRELCDIFMSLANLTHVETAEGRFRVIDARATNEIDDCMNDRSLSPDL